MSNCKYQFIYTVYHIFQQMQQQSRKIDGITCPYHRTQPFQLNPVLLPAKKKRRECGTSGFIAKIFVYRDYFQAPAAYTHSYQPHQF